MNTISSARKRKVARVAIDVRLYFDVPISSEETAAIQQAALDALERVVYEEVIRVQKLRFPNIYPLEDAHAVRPGDFQICQICHTDKANRHTRFAL